MTLWQPYASLIALGAKWIETRSWSTNYRGPIAIHAAARRPSSTGRLGEFWVDGRRLVLGQGATEHPLALGVIVATARLADVVPMVEREWIEGGFVGMRRDVLATMPADHPASGQLHLWRGGEFHSAVTDQRPYGDFRPGRFAWLLEDVKPLAEPVPAKGRQQLWEWAA